MRVFVNLTIVLNAIVLRAQFGSPYTSLDTARVQIIYSLKYQADSMNPSYYIRQEDMVLFVGKRMSKFLSINHYSGDSIARRFSSPEAFVAYFNANPNAHRPVIIYQIYTNYPAGKLTVSEHLIGNTFLYEEDRPVCRWQLSGETQYMHGRNAQMATCQYGGRQWIAWFTPEIPIFDGPNKFDGLPGLILKVYDAKGHYSFDFVSIRIPARNIVIDLEQKDYIRCSRTDFFNARARNQTEVQRRLREMGAGENTIIEVYRRVAS